MKVSSSHAIEIKNLTKTFGALAAVDDVSIVVEEGKIHSVIGPNGAGKTTLFNLICGNLRCASGQVWFFGQDITHVPPHERVRMGLARTFQVTNLFPDFLVGNTLMLTMAPRILCTKTFRLAQDESPNVLATLEQFGLSEKWGVRIKNLSHGEQRQIEIILGLLLYPRVLLLDEPTAGLSRAETSQMLSIIRQVAKKTTVVLIEHDLDVVFELSDRITVMNYGRVICEGEREEIKTDPRVQEAYLGGAA